MDHLQRLIVALVALFCMGSAHATITPAPEPGTPTYWVWPYGDCKEATPTAAGAVCSLTAQHGNPNFGNCVITVGYPSQYNSEGNCTYLPNGNQVQTYATLTGCPDGQTFDAVSKVCRVPGLVCPANSTQVGSTCSCNAGYLESAGACTALPPPTCKAASLGSVNFEFPVTAGGSVSGQLPASMTACTPVAATSTTAAGGCNHKYDLLLASRSSDGATTAIGNYAERTDGTNCTPGSNPNPVPESGPAPTNPTAPGTGGADDPKPTPNPSTICALGAGSVAMCPTMINGSVACVVCGQMATAGNGSSGGTGTAPAGPASAPGSGSGSGASGIGQSINTGNGSVGIPVGGTALQGTECTNGVCTTKTFVKDAGGTVVGAYTSTTPQTVFCSKNAGDPICVAQNTGPSGKPGTGSGSGGGGTGGTGEGEAAPTFGGTCGAGFTCTGDAVQCAMARDQMLRNCKNFDDAPSNDPVVQATNAAASSPAGHPINSGTSKSLTFDQTNIMSGSCPADVSVTVSHFNAVTLPFSALCTPATWLGNILVGITALSCLGIVFVRGS